MHEAPGEGGKSCFFLEMAARGRFSRVLRLEIGAERRVFPRGLK